MEPRVSLYHGRACLVGSGLKVHVEITTCDLWLVSFELVVEHVEMCLLGVLLEG